MLSRLPTPRPDATTLLSGSPFGTYSYSYPHKSAYRILSPPLPIADAWRGADLSSLMLYVHLPFCEHRCGFCNLFAEARPRTDVIDRYLQALARQTRVVRSALPEYQIARIAIGGGTPTLLSPAQLETLFEIIRESGGTENVPISVEASPATIDAKKLAVLRDHGTTRLSVGIQSFDERDSAGFGRQIDLAEIESALRVARDVGFATLNLDLIYGAETQTIESFVASVRTALRWSPEEIYLYPLYVRPLTGLGRLAHDWDDFRLAAYLAGRDELLSHGYTQVSFRMFRSPQAPAEDAPVYCCQSDGMVGLGCGARSYSTRWHYSHEFAVSQSRIRHITERFAESSDDDFARLWYGVRLTDDEIRRRFVILSLLPCDGLKRAAYLSHFGDDILTDFPELIDLREYGLVTLDDKWCRLTTLGVSRSDRIGEWLYSPSIRALMEAAVCH